MEGRGGREGGKEGRREKEEKNKKKGRGWERRRGGGWVGTLRGESNKKLEGKG